MPFVASGFVAVLAVVAPVIVPMHAAVVAPARTVTLQAHRAASAIAPTGPVPVSVPIVLPPPPPVTGAVTSTLNSALLAITQAQQIDPAAAQTAAFEYDAALQQYRSGRFAAARISALQALSTASQAQVRATAPAALPTPAFVTAPPQLPGLQGGLYGGDAPAIDAASFIALARGILDDCAARHDRRLTAAQAHFHAAQRDFDARDWEATRLDAKAAIDACAQPR